MPETNAQYHADFSHWGSTMLGVYDGSPAEAHAIYIARTLERDPPTPEMIRGSLVHVFVLEPDALEREYLVAEGVARRSGKKWDALKERAADEGKTPVLPSQIEEARGMAASVFRHSLASTILEHAGPIEQAIRWTDPDTGLKLKCKPDVVIFDEKNREALLPDLKTTADLAAFGRKAVPQYRYHRQMKLYSDGVRTTLPEGTLIQPLWIIVGKRKPYDVLVRRPPPGMMLDATEDLADVLGRLAQSFKTDTWELPGSNTIETIDELPHWAKKR